MLSFKRTKYLAKIYFCKLPIIVDLLKGNSQCCCLVAKRDVHCLIERYTNFIAMPTFIFTESGSYVNGNCTFK
jgi:hypothetical protein